MTKKEKVAKENPLEVTDVTVSRRARLQDIAKRCGVSISTVSRALSGEKGVNPELRRKVQEVARAVRYAVPLEIGGSRIIIATSRAAMIDYSRNQFTWYVLQGVQERARMMGIEITTQPITDSDVSPITDLMQSSSVAGVIFLTVDDPVVLDAAAQFSKPVVLVNSDDPLMRLSSVLPCNRSAARLATDYLITMGHKQIAFLTCPGRRTIEQRVEGWRDSMLSHQLACDAKKVIAVSDWLPELAERAICEAMQNKRNRFSAILCASDSLAIGAIQALNKLGLKVPDDVSVIGMNDLPQAEFLDPPLTTVHLPVQEMGMIALELLQDGMSGTTGIPRRIELACSLVVRKSVAGI
ncbi:MAG: LacI family DNA-binding transcriptional regulator [Formivibrio sp.]|nr:LacI family DNA-binding transcriptional regulator [Formivibrio sp.]